MSTTGKDHPMTSQSENTVPGATIDTAEGRIYAEWYINAGEAVVANDLQPPVPSGSLLHGVTLCILQLRGGGIVTGQSVLMSGSRHDEAKGRLLARLDAMDKLRAEG